jgi:hypothetical protein
MLNRLNLRYLRRICKIHLTRIGGGHAAPTSTLPRMWDGDDHDPEIDRCRRQRTRRVRMPSVRPSREAHGKPPKLQASSVSDLSRATRRGWLGLRAELTEQMPRPVLNLRQSSVVRRNGAEDLQRPKAAPLRHNSSIVPVHFADQILERLDAGRSIDGTRSLTA